MKQLVEAFKSAKKSEIIIVIAALFIIIVLLFGQNSSKNIPTSEDERRIQHVLAQIEGAGRVSLVIAHNEAGKPQGALVTASGADDLHVRLRIQQAVHTLTGLELEQIDVVKSKR